MLGVPVCFEVRVDLAVDDEHARSALLDPCLDRRKVVHRAYRRAPRAVTAGNRGEIGIGKTDDVGGVTLPANRWTSAA